MGHSASINLLPTIDWIIWNYWVIIKPLQAHLSIYFWRFEHKQSAD